MLKRILKSVPLLKNFSVGGCGPKQCGEKLPHGLNLEDFSGLLEGTWYDENLDLVGSFSLQPNENEYPWKWTSEWECTCEGTTNTFNGVSSILANRIVTTLNPDPQHDACGVVVYTMENNTLFANWSEFGFLGLSDCPGIGVALSDHPNVFPGDWNMNYMFSHGGEPGYLFQHITVEETKGGDYALEWKDSKDAEVVNLKGFGVEIEENIFGIAWGEPTKYEDLKLLNLLINEPYLQNGLLCGCIFGSGSGKCSGVSVNLKKQ